MHTPPTPRAKNEATAIGERYKQALFTIDEMDGQYTALFSDLQHLVTKSDEDLVLLIDSRLQQHEQSERDRLERERVAEEQRQSAKRAADEAAAAQASAPVSSAVMALFMLSKLRLPLMASAKSAAIVGSTTIPPKVVLTWATCAASALSALLFSSSRAWVLRSWMIFSSSMRFLLTALTTTPSSPAPRMLCNDSSAAV